jgi:hypothetical protein
MSDLTAFLRARLDEDEGYLNSNRHHLWTDRPLREVEAKRAILTEYAHVRKLQELTGADQDGYRDWVLRHLAAVYSDHPDYDPGWKP